MHTTIDMWHFLTGNNTTITNTTNGNGSNGSSSSDDDNVDHLVGDLGTNDILDKEDGLGQDGQLHRDGRLSLGLSPEEARAFVRQGNLGYLKVGASGVRGKLDYIAAVELYLLLATNTPPSLTPSSTQAQALLSPVTSTLVDVQGLACLLPQSNPTAPPSQSQVSQSMSKPLSLTVDVDVGVGVHDRLVRLHRSIARAVLLAQPLVLTLSSDR